MNELNELFSKNLKLNDNKEELSKLMNKYLITGVQKRKMLKFLPLIS